ncbi:MAG: universal stress protein [Candidatus Promineifilaceae bacterium]|nr:universal stress protein [Candidatus Promineifilaceae bacterium]
MSAQLRGRSDRLLSYSEVSDQLHAGEPVDRGLKEIPLDAIVGSVGRYRDFTRRFLPRTASAQSRWSRVRAAFPRVEDIPPILVYQLGDSYFVLDGNHRVSVARVLGATHIPAYVTEVETRVPLTPDADTDQLICQAKYVDFLETTELDRLRPASDLTVTAPGQYRVLKDQIRRHRHWLGEQGTEATLEGAAASWYDQIYMPVVEIIRRRGILRHFPGRTETDLYVWLVRHHAQVAEALGWEVEPEVIAGDLVARFAHPEQPLWVRMRDRMLEAITPEPLDAGPPPGEWREMYVASRSEAVLFPYILVPIGGSEAGWRALAQAIIVCRRENATLHGLHVLSDDLPPVEVHPDGLNEDARVSEVQEEFEGRLRLAGISGALMVESGPLADAICEQARWHDLLVIGQPSRDGEYAPGARERLLSAFSQLVRRCGRPLLIVPGEPTALQRPLLAYDGSPKAREALFVAAYLAAKWECPLTVVIAAQEGEAEEAERVLEEVRFYLIARGISATYVVEQGAPAAVVRQSAESGECDLILMGGYGFTPLLEVVLGSLVDEVLSWQRWPVLICR